MRKEEERELAALEYAGQPCLPEPADENTPLWIYAIAKVRMNNLSRGYAIIKNDFTKFPYTIKIFGDGAISASVLRRFLIPTGKWPIMEAYR